MPQPIKPYSHTISQSASATVSSFPAQQNQNTFRDPAESQQSNRPLQIGGGKPVGANLGSNVQAAAFARFDIDAAYQTKHCPVWQQYFFWDLFANGQ